MTGESLFYFLGAAALTKHTDEVPYEEQRTSNEMPSEMMNGWSLFWLVWIQIEFPFCTQKSIIRLTPCQNAFISRSMDAFISRSMDMVSQPAGHRSDQPMFSKQSTNRSASGHNEISTLPAAQIQGGAPPVVSWVIHQSIDTSTIYYHIIGVTNQLS